MRYLFIFNLFVLSGVIGFSQTNGAFGVEFNNNSIFGNAMDFNRANSQKFENNPPYLNIVDPSKINRVHDVDLNMFYQLNDNLSIGLELSTMFASGKIGFRQITGLEYWWMPNDTTYGTFNHLLRYYNFGLQTEFRLKNLLNDSARKFISNLKPSIKLSIGYSNAQFISYTLFDNHTPSAVVREINRVDGIYTSILFKVGMPLIQSHLFSHVGFQFGYQQLLTTKVEGGNTFWFSQTNAPTLNFYGISVGIYLNLGKN